MLDPEIESMLAAAKNGDADAVARLPLRYSSKLIDRLSSRIRLNPFIEFTVDDVLQEVFVDVYRGIASFEPRTSESFESWIHRVADNRLASMLRASRQLKRRGNPKQASTTPPALSSSIRSIIAEISDSNAATASQIAIREELVNELRENLLRLPEAQREAVQHHFLEQRSLKSTATQMQTTVTAVRGLLHRAKKSIRAIMTHSTRWIRK